MKKVFKKSVSMLLCLTLLATAFCIPGLISSASEGWSSISSYDELSGIYDDFVYIGTEVYETDYEGNNPVLTDYRVKAGDWLEVRTYIKSDHYIGDTSIVSLFSNDFFDVKDPNGTMSGSNEYYSGELYTVNDMHHVVESRDIRAQVNTKPVSEFTALTKTSNIEYPEMYDAVMVNTTHGTSDNNLAGDYVSDYWVYSYKVQVKYDLADGMTGSISSPLELWQSAINESTGQYDRRKRSYVYLSPEKIGYETDEVLYSQCDIMADIMNGVCEMNVIIDDMNHEFIIGNDRYNLTLDANGGCFDDGQAVFYGDFEAGEELPYLPYPQRPGYIFMGWADNNYGELNGYPSVMPENDLKLYAVWEYCEYEITFDANGGWFHFSNTELIRRRYQSDMQIQLPENPERIGYSFAGWATERDAFEAEDVVNNMPYCDLQYYAVWYPNDGTEYKVNYYRMNPDGTYSAEPDMTETFISRTGETVIADCPEIEGFSFDNEQSIAEGVVQGDGSLLLEIYLERNKYNAVFDSNGGWFFYGDDTLIYDIYYGAEIPEPEPPKKDGYEFAGWTYEEGSDIIADIENMRMPLYGIRFYAVFVPCDDTPYTVETFMMNTEGEYELTETVIHTGTTDHDVEYIPPVKEGLAVDYDKSTLHGMVEADGSLVLRVYYERIKFVVTFDDSYETVSSEYYYGSMIEEPVQPCREGYYFDGWIDSEGNYTSFPCMMPDRDIRFTAMWYPREYTIHYNADGGYFRDGSDEITETYRFDEVITRPDYPCKEGYNFLGWLDEKTGEEVYLPAVMPAYDINLRALWKAESYTLYFDDGNGNTIGVFEMCYGEPILFVEAPETEGFTFAGWMNEYGEIYYEEGFPMPACDLHLSACWTRNKYTVMWVDDGEVVHEEFADFDSVLSHPNALYKDGYIFKGWEGPDGCIYNENSDYLMPAEDITFNAVYIPETDTPYTVEVYEMHSDGCYPEYPSYTNCFVGETDCIAVINPENYIKVGFTVDFSCSIFEGIILADGSLVLKVYLARNECEVIFDTGYSAESQIYYYGSLVAEPVQPCREGYYFNGWTDENGNYVRFPFIMPAESITLHASWVNAEYKITFDAGDGEFSDGYNKEEYLYHYSDEIYFPEEPVREGFTFIGWDSAIPEYMPACDIHFVAMWEANKYSISFLDGFGNIFREETFLYGEDLSHILYDIPIPTMEGYIFVRWEEEYSGNDVFPQTMPSMNLTYTARWERNVCQIEWINDGEIWEISEVEYGAETEPPADPVKDGFTFMGWFDEEGNLMEFPFVAERDITLHAYWEANEYNIVFHADGGEFISGEHEIETTLRYGEEIRRPDYPCKEGYYFLGWSTDPGSPYLVEIPETMPAHDLVLYAVWQVREFTLSFDDGFGNVFLSLNMDYGEDMGIVEYISCPKHDGLVFRYWADSETGEELIFPSFMPSHDITLVAVWDYSDFTVTFDYNGGYDSWGNPAIDMIFRTGDPVDCEIPFREGFTFAGWEDRHGNRVDTPLIMPEEDIILYAVWELNRYRITFTDGFGWVMFEEEYYYGEAIDFREAPEKEGYTFAGWYSDYGYDCPPVMPAHDIVLHASWVVNEFRIRWIADGVYDEETVYEYGQEIIPPANPEKEGYVFAGWDSSVPQTMPAENLVFTAIWEQARPVIYRTETYTMNTAGTYDKSVVSHSMEKSGEVSAEPVIPEGFELNDKKSVLTGYAHTDEELVLKIYIDRQSFCFTKTINGSSTSVEYFYGSVISEPVTPELSGHIFTGWEPQVPHTMPAHDVTVTATFREMTEDESENAEITFYITPLKNVTLNYGESITLRAYTKNLPAGSEVRWSVDTKAVTINPSADGRLCTVTAVSSGGAAITARVVDGNGRTVSDKNGNELKDTETVYSEYNTWLMILNFFRKLFNFSF